MARKKGEQKLPETKNSVTGEAQGSRPTALFPTWEIPLALKGVEKGAEKLIEWYKAEGPLSIQILDSGPQEATYVVTFRATNMTVHGIYVDSFMLVAPTELKMPISPIGAMNFGQNAPKTSETASTLIRPGQSIEFIIRFPAPTPEDLKTGWFKSEKRLGSGKIEYWILNEESSRTRDVAFSIRLK